ncbi:MAG: ABC transporter permease [Planctomycetota bacterium]|nr:ABC transporter permease [Planctomycetota bacterium]
MPILTLLTITATMIANGQDDSVIAKSTRIRIESVPQPISGLVVQYGLKRDDFKLLRVAIPQDNIVVPVRESNGKIRFGDRVVDSQVLGTSPEFAKLNGVVVRTGRFLTERDLQQLENVAVIGESASRRLFPGKAAIGNNIRVGDEYFLVIGVVAETKPATKSGAPRNAVFIPISTMRSRLGDREFRIANGSREMHQFELSRIEIGISQPQDVRAIGEIVRQTLLRIHEDQDYSITIPR